MQTILIAGVLAYGKSYFGTWLAREKNFIHLDVEKESGRCLRELNLMKDWLACCQTGQAKDFVERLQNLGKSVVFDWGFPTNCLNVVEALKTAGVQVWWFNGDHEMARNAFLKRGGLQIQSFDKQVADIRRDWEQIMSVFGPNILKTLMHNGKYLHPRRIYRYIFVNPT